jgi:hypothetical protein
VQGQLAGVGEAADRRVLAQLRQFLGRVGILVDTYRTPARQSGRLQGISGSGVASARLRPAC